jgi:hypothetical protein
MMTANREKTMVARCEMLRNKRQGVASSLLSSERATLGESGLSSCWLAENGGATSADDDSLCVGEDGGDGEAAWALDIHEEGSWCWHKVLKETVSFRGSIELYGVVQDAQNVP